MRSRWLVVAIASCALSWLATAQERPRRSKLVEETGRRLVQLDVAVSGPAEAIADLTRQDFELVVGGKTVESFTVDNLCEPTAALAERAAQPPAARQTPGGEILPPRTTANFLFYFDQDHLTLQGRLRAADVARDLVGDLIREGNRGMIVSNGRDLRTFAELTDDPQTLLDALDRVENDTQHWWDPTAEPEEKKIVEVLEALADDAGRALSIARRHAMEERWRTEKSLRLFSIVLARMADLDPPRAVIYFADSMRQNAGEHFLSFFGKADRLRDQHSLTVLDAAHAFQGLLEEANALGVRVYTIQAEGLADDSSLARFVRGAPGSQSSYDDDFGNSQRIRDAQNSLVGLALESGGKHFLNGVRASKIAREIQEDLSCLYLISFDPVGLRMNSPLPVLLRTLRPKVKSRVRGRVVVHSDDRRLTARLLAAFATPDGVESEFPIHGIVIPTGFEEGRYSALVQLYMPGTPLPVSAWDLGMSLISRDEVREDASGSVRVNGAGMPVVFEAQMSFPPGPFEIVAVAHETTSDAIATTTISGDWPDPDEGPATVGMISVVQPHAGAFLRGETLRRSGPVGLTAELTAQPDRPTALVGIVCRGKGKQSRLKVERRLVGLESVEFPSEGLDPRDGRCALFSDLIRAGTMTAGGFRYEVHVVDDGGEEVASGSREFSVRGADAPILPAGS